MGKGDTPRPMSVDHDTYASNWDRCFKKPADRLTPEQQAECRAALDELIQLSQEMGLYDEPTKDLGTEERSDGEGK